jgi:hypothetical protein
MRYEFIPILLMICLFLCGCSFVDNTSYVVQTLPKVTLTETMVSTLSNPTTTIPLTPFVGTLTASPSRTPQPSKTQFPLSTMTLTPVATLTSEMAKQILDDFMKTNGGFPLFEFFGIVPNQTTLTDAQNIFNRLRAPLILMSQENGLEYYSTNINYQSNVWLSPLIPVRAGTIQSFYVAVDIQQDAMRWSDVWPTFSPEALIAQLGGPSAVRFRLEYPHESGFPAGTAWYDMTMYFDEVKLMILYGRAPVTDMGGVVYICPIKDAFSSGRVWFGDDPENPPYPGLELTDVSNLTIDEFQSLLVDKAEQACFDLNAKAFYP